MKKIIGFSGRAFLGIACLLLSMFVLNQASDAINAASSIHVAAGIVAVFAGFGGLIGTGYVFTSLGIDIIELYSNTAVEKEGESPNE